MNMSYCRFQNTVRDLRDCADHMDELDEDSHVWEISSRKELIKLCARIVEENADLLESA